MFVDNSFYFAYLSRSDSIGRLPSPVILRRPHALNIFSENTGPIKAKFHMKHSQEGETKVCIIGQGHITKMAAMPIYGNNLIVFSSPEPQGDCLEM